MQFLGPNNCPKPKLQQELDAISGLGDGIWDFVVVPLVVVPLFVVAVVLVAVSCYCWQLKRTHPCTPTGGHAHQARINRCLIMLKWRANKSKSILKLG